MIGTDANGSVISICPPGSPSGVCPPGVIDGESSGGDVILTSTIDPSGSHVN